MAKKDKGQKKGAKAVLEGDMPISIAAHPRATRSVGRIKAWAGLLGFVVTLVLSWRAGVEPFELGLRALVAGLLFYLAAWFAALALWRQIVISEVKTEIRRLREEREEALRRLEEAEAGDGETRVMA